MYQKQRRCRGRLLAYLKLIFTTDPCLRIRDSTCPQLRARTDEGSCAPGALRALSCASGSHQLHHVLKSPGKGCVFIVTYFGKYCPVSMDARIGIFDSHRYEWVERCCSDGNYYCMDTILANEKKQHMDVECSSCRCIMAKKRAVCFILLCFLTELSLSAQQVLRIGE